MAYDVITYKVRYLAADTSQPLPGGTVTLALPPSDVPAAPNVLLIDVVTVQCDQLPPTAAYLFDNDPTVNAVVPMAFTLKGNGDQGESSSGLVIPSGSNLYVQWTGVDAGAVPMARIQFRLARPVDIGQPVPQAHPILGG